MKVLVVNAGSSSVKFSLYDARVEKEIIWCHYDRLGKQNGQFWVRHKGKQVIIDLPMRDLDHAFRHFLEYLLKMELITGLADIGAVAHRVVHGGELFNKTTIITDAVEDRIGALSVLAPLHNPHNLHGINTAQRFFKNIPHVAVFDTAYHHTIPEHAWRYGIPDELYKKHKVRKYGFHGTSHKYLANEARRLGNKKIITCHLGNGSSVTANTTSGTTTKSIDTSMGFTPTDGLIMGTRSGSIDPEAVLYLARRLKMTSFQMADYLNKECGLKGVSGVSSDIRDLRKASTTRSKAKTAQQDKEGAKRALDMLTYDIKQHIGMYDAVLNGAGCIVFSGGIGENAWFVREAALSGLEHLGIKLDKRKNKQAIEPKKPALITTPASKVKVYVIRAHEALQMVREAKAVLGTSKKTKKRA